MTQSLFTTIVVGSDGSATAALAIERAAEIARFSDAKVHIVGASSGRGLAKLEEILGAEAQKLRDGGLVAGVQVREGDAEDVLVDIAQELGADLVVVGNRGMTGARRFILGSVPDKVSHRAHCSVLIANTA